MYAYKFKELAKRGSALLGAAGMLAGIGTTALPVLVSADALNPLTERSLTLSSSSPGWSYLDGSGNTTYAPPNSGANGKKTGNTFTFRMSSLAGTVKAITFQYCTTAAGDCLAPGNNGWTGSSPSASRNGDTTTTTDLNVVTNGSQNEISPTDWTAVTGSADKTPAADGSEGNFIVLHGAATAGSANTYSNGGSPTDDYWTMENADGLETGDPTTADATGKNNLITITSSGGQALSGTSVGTSGDYFKVIFFGTDDNYITNPGAGAFFVRINTYSSTTPSAGTLIDGGVTVANVMNQSITIQTKVLETMDFSVGVFDPDTITFPNATVTGNIGTLTAHAQCAPVLRKDPTLSSGDYTAASDNVLKMGNPTGEYSLETGTSYDQKSYWRLSSNSSGGATVYYTGHTLTNTVGDQILPLKDNTSGSVGTGLNAGTISTQGTEQFGLAIDHGTGGATIGGSSVGQVFPTGDNYGSGAGSFANYVSTTINDDTKAHLPRLYPLVPVDEYGNGNGYINGNTGTAARFSFNENADTYAIPIATETTDVVNCVTAKMRYIANIAATTPAGIYTTKVNYVASPQY